MSGGDSGGGTQTSRPLTAAERSELYDAAMNKIGGYVPSASSYQGFTIHDPSADRGRGSQDQYGGGTGYAGYSNIAPRTIDDGYSSYKSGYDTATSSVNNTLAAYLDEYFKQRDASTNDEYGLGMYGE